MRERNHTTHVAPLLLLRCFAVSVGVSQSGGDLDKCLFVFIACLHTCVPRVWRCASVVGWLVCEDLDEIVMMDCACERTRRLSTLKSLNTKWLQWPIKVGWAAGMKQGGGLSAYACPLRGNWLLFLLWKFAFLIWRKLEIVSCNGNWWGQLSSVCLRLRHSGFIRRLWFDRLRRNVLISRDFKFCSRKQTL